MGLQLYSYYSYGPHYLSNSSGVFPDTSNFTIMMWLKIDVHAAISNLSIYRLQDGNIWPSPSPSHTPSPSSSASKSPSVSRSKSPSKSSSLSPSKSASSSVSRSPSISLSPSSSESLSFSPSESISPSESASISPSASSSKSASISPSSSSSKSSSISPSASISASKSGSVSPSPDPGISDQPAWALGYLDNTTTIHFKMYDGSGGYLSLEVGSPGTTLIVGQWYHITYVKSGSSHTVYRDGLPISSGTLAMPLNTNSWAWGREYLGSSANVRDGFTTAKWSFAYFRVWEAALSQSEIVAEKLSASAKKQTDLFRDIAFSYTHVLAESIPNDQPWGVFWAWDDSGFNNHFVMRGTYNYTYGWTNVLGPTSLPVLFSDNFDNGLTGWDSSSIQTLIGVGDQATNCVGSSGTAVKTFAAPLKRRGSIRMQISYRPPPDVPPATQGVQTRALIFQILDTENPDNPLGIRFYVWSNGSVEFVSASNYFGDVWALDNYNGWAPFTGGALPTNGTIFAFEMCWHASECLIEGIQDWDLGGNIYINGKGSLGGGIGGYFEPFVPQWNQITISGSSSPEAYIKIDSLEIDDIGEPRSFSDNIYVRPAPWPVSRAPVRAAYPVAIQVPVYSWLYVPFSRGALAPVGLKYQWAYNAWWQGHVKSNYDVRFYYLPDEWINEAGPLTLYPEIVLGDSFCVVDGLMQVATPPAQDMYDPFIYFSVYKTHWNPLTSAQERDASSFTPNNARQRLYIEVKVKFDQDYYDQVGGGWGWDASFYPQGNDSNVFLYLSFNTSAAEVEDYGDSGGTPGTHTFMLITNNTDPSAVGPIVWYGDDEYRAVGSFLHAELFDGQEHILRLEWKSATVTSSLVDYRNYEISTLVDGELQFSVDGVIKYSRSNAAFCLDTEWYYDATYSDVPAAFAALGKYNKVVLESFMACKYVYVKAGIVDGGWIDIADFIEQEVSDSDFVNGVARVRCKLWTRDSGVMVKARLYDVINAVSVGESAEIISQTPVDATFSVALTAGVTRYHLQVTSDTVESDLFAIGAGLIS